MAGRRRRWVLFALCLVATLAATAGVLYRASGHVPQFYAEAMKPAPAQSQSGQEMKQGVASLTAQTLRDGRWRATFSQRQINGFLAVDLLEKHPNVLPPGIHDPRVAIAATEASIGWKSEGRWPAVYSLSIVPYVPQPNVLAVRIKSIRAGAVPVPLGEVVNGLSVAARQAGLRLQWQQLGGDPVALIELPTDPSTRQQMVLDAVELTDGAIVVAGHTENASAEAQADHSSSNSSRQR